MRGANRAIGLVVALTLLATLVGCVPTPKVTPKDPYAAAEVSYGGTPIAGQGANFQPDVVLIGAGGAAVDSVTQDGITWTLKAESPGVSDLAVGKIMFVTGRGVGRVLAVQRAGGTAAVTIGPVTITDVIRDGDFASTGPVSLSKAIVYQAPDPFWSDPEGTREDGSPLIAPAAAVRPVDFPVVPPAVGTTADTVAAGFNVTSSCCDSGVGANFSYGVGGLEFAGSIKLRMAKPSATFALRISGGTVTSASFHLLGSAGLDLAVQAGTSPDGFKNVNRALPVSVDFSVPVATIIGVPLTATVSQFLNVQTAFTAKTAYVSASGSYDFAGGLGFDYSNGKFTPSVVSGLTVVQSVIGSMEDLSIGVTGIIFDDHVTFSIGIGAYNFRAGVFFTLTATLALGLGSAAGVGLAVCRSAQLGLWANYGIGYHIPKPVASLINFFLEHFHTKPIAADGGLDGTANNFFNKYVVDPPDVKICQ